MYASNYCGRYFFSSLVGIGSSSHDFVVMDVIILMMCSISGVVIMSILSVVKKSVSMLLFVMLWDIGF